MSWPKLSATLPFERRPDGCQSCGDFGGQLEYWRECDEHDRPTTTLVALCSACAKRLIEPHPRLYSQEPKNKPLPGAMPHLCLDCTHREFLTCRHPLLKANGGAGLNILCVEPLRGFADGTRGGRRCGWQFELWSKPASGCTGLEKKADAAK